MGRTRDHLKKHRTKYTLASATVGLAAILQLFGVLSPLLCMMPWVTNYDKCMEAGQRATRAAESLGQLDGMRLDGVDAGTEGSNAGL